jgi:hypothetical protein
LTSNCRLKLWLLCLSLLLVRPALADPWHEALHLARQPHGAQQAADRLQAVPGTQRLRSELHQADDAVSLGQALQDLQRADALRQHRPPAASRWRSQVENVARRSQYGEVADHPEWLRKLLQDLARWLEPGTNPGLGFASQWVIWVLLAALAIALIVALLSWLRRSAVALPAVPPLPEVQSTTPQSAEFWWQAADREAAGGRYREAVRLGFSATLADLYEKADLRKDERLTHGEMQRQLAQAGHGEASRTLAAARRVFEPIWYGMADARSDDWIAMTRFRHDAA